MNEILGALDFDIELLCLVPRVLLWYSTPTSPNNDLLNDGVVLGMYSRVTDMAIETSFKFPFTQIQKQIQKYSLFGRTKIDAGDANEQMGVEALNFRCLDGTCGEALTNCLEIQTTTLMLILTGNEQNFRETGLWVNKWDGKSPFTSPSRQRKRKMRKMTLLKKTWPMRVLLGQNAGETAEAGRPVLQTRRRVVIVRVSTTKGIRTTGKKESKLSMRQECSQVQEKHLAQELQRKAQHKGRSFDTDRRIEVPGQGNKMNCKMASERC